MLKNTQIHNLKSNDKITSSDLNSLSKVPNLKELTGNKQSNYRVYDNSIPMLQLLNKVCSVFRPGVLSNNYIYNYNKSNKYKLYKLINHINHILNHFFGTFYGIISKPILLFSQNKLLIFINYYLAEPSNKLINRYNWKYDKNPAKSGDQLDSELIKLIKLLSKLLNLKVELQLNQLKYPYHDSTILSKFISLNTNKKRFHTIMSTIYKKAFIINKNLKNDDNNYYEVIIGDKLINIHKTIPTVLIGLKVKISGRLMTEKVLPRKTINKREIGGFKKTNNNIIDYAIYTNKNKRGSYSVKVWTTSKITLQSNS